MVPLTSSNDLDDFADLPPRSDLYRLPFHGVGTPLVQSLISYIVQMADAHVVRPFTILNRLYGFVARRENPRRQQIGGTLQPKESQSLLSFGASSSRIVSAVDALTSQSVAAAGTFSHLEGIVANNCLGLVASFRQWCPACMLEAGAEKLRTIAEPLAWSASAATACASHGTRLAKACAHCGKPQPYFCHVPNNVDCWCCKRPLYAPACSQPQADERGRWYARELGWLIQARDRLTPSEARANFVHSLKRLVQVTGLTHIALDRGIGFTDRVIYQWVNKPIRPRPDLLLHFSFQTRTSLEVLLLTPDHATFRDCREPEKIRVRKASRRPDIDAMREAFIQVNSTGSPSLTLMQTAMKLGTSVAKLRYYFPELCREVSRRAAKSMEDERNRLAASASALIEVTAKKLLLAGHYPSYRAVHRALPRSARIRLETDPELKLLRARLAMESGMLKPAGGRDGSRQLRLADDW